MWYDLISKSVDFIRHRKNITLNLEKFKKEEIHNCHLEGKNSNEWKLIDGIDIIVHIFNTEKRKFYNLEKKLETPFCNGLQYQLALVLQQLKH